MCEALERRVFQHCGAVLFEKKPAALFPCVLMPEQVAPAREELEESGLALLVLRWKAPEALVLVYKPDMLWQALQNKVSRKHLGQIGYPLEQGLPAVLAYLVERFRNEPGFPHEIGFFLGYPPADVVGFMMFGGRCCKHCCAWKVYSDVEKAKALHQQFEDCRMLARRHYEDGGDLKSLYHACAKAG